MKRKLIAVIAVFMLAVGMLAGCSGSKEVTAKSLLEEVQSNVDKKKSLESKMTLSMEMSGDSLKDYGGSMTVTMDMDVQTTTDPVANYMSGKMGVLGVNMDMQVYTVVEDKKICNYINMMNQWMVQKYDYNADDVNKIDAAGKDLLKNSDSLTLAKDTKDVDGKQAYIITGTLTGDAIQDLLESASSTMGTMLGSSSDIDLSKMSVDIEYAVSKDDKLPLYTNLTFKGMDSLTGETDVTVGNFTMKMTYTGFDTVDKITVPQEAIDNATDITSSLGTGTTDTSAAAETSSDAGVSETAASETAAAK